MKRRNERTSKSIATLASEVVREADRAIDEIRQIMKLLRKAKRVAASALTQAPDHKP